MRAVVCGLVLVAATGCGSKGTSSPPAPAGEPGAGGDALPAPTSKLKIREMDLAGFYCGHKTLPKHEHEGKRVLCKLGGNTCYGVEKDSKCFVLAENSDGFRRPRTVFALRDKRGFKKGADGYPHEVYFEGVLRGAVAIDAVPWAKEWLTMSDYWLLNGCFILIEDAIMTTVPKD